MAVTNLVLNCFTPEEAFKYLLNIALSLTDYDMNDNVNEKMRLNEYTH